MKKGLALVTGVMLMFSCAAAESELQAVVSPANQTIVALASKTYDDAQLLEISQFDGSLNELNAQYPAECVREENGLYRVSYLGSESVAALLFNGAGNRLLGRVYSAQLQKRISTPSAPDSRWMTCCALTRTANISSSSQAEMTCRVYLPITPRTATSFRWNMIRPTPSSAFGNR